MISSVTSTVGIILEDFPVQMWSLCCSLVSEVPLWLEPVYCCFHLNSKQICYALFIFPFTPCVFFCLFASVYDCYISSAVCICWC